MSMSKRVLFIPLVGICTLFTVPLWGGFAIGYLPTSFDVQAIIAILFGCLWALVVVAGIFWWGQGWNEMFGAKAKVGWRGLRWGSTGFVAGSPFVKPFDFVKKCPECYGKGWDADWGGPHLCDFCGGTGRHPDSNPRKCRAKGHQLQRLKEKHEPPYSFTAACPCGQQQENFVGLEACREAQKYGVWFGPRNMEKVVR